MKYLLASVVITFGILGFTQATDTRELKAKAPRVELLRETFGTEGALPLDGMPVLVVGSLRISYVCQSPNGLSKASLLYRVLKNGAAGKGAKDKEPWIVLPLVEVKADEKTGPFNPKTGVFANTKFDQEMQFHAAPAPGRTVGGGRVMLNTKGLPDSKGKRVDLRPGDQIEYCIEVTEVERKPMAAVPAGRSQTRVTAVVSPPEFEAWIFRAFEEDKRIRELERKQKGLFRSK